MRRRYLTTDVFTERLFGGNPLAVVLDAGGLSKAQMQSVAAEFGYAETTFVLPPRAPAHTARLRIFTPRSELPFAGHPNVGTAFVLARALAAGGKPVPERIVFEEDAGLVPLRVLRAEGRVVGAELKAPERLSQRARVSVEQAAASLSLRPEEIATTRHAPQVVSVGLPFLVVEIATREALRRSRPDVAAHEALLPLDGADAVYCYVRESGGARSAPTTLHARMYAPLDGIVEDPATGSATAAALAYLDQLEERPDGERRWLVHQGVDLGRPSLLLGRTERLHGVVEAVHVGGQCVAVMEGYFELAGDAPADGTSA